MNYRHAFHAGNFADVVKHVTLVALLEALQRKEAPYAYLETHAGAGRYDLEGEAARTGEYLDGVMRLDAAAARDAPRRPADPTVARYLGLVRAENPDAAAGTLRHYPGSPLIAARLARADDRLVLCELVEEPAAALKRTFAGDPRVAVHRRDGYEALRALLPPTPRRGLVLIDPPFEAQERELDAVRQALESAFTRWANGIYAVWYPIKLRQHVNPFHRWLRGAGVPNVVVAELCVRPDDSALRLNGCGLAILNAPYRLEHALAPAYAAMHRALAPDGAGLHRVDALVA